MKAGRPARLKRVACVLLMLGAASAAAVYALAGHVMLGAQAYLFGYPLLSMDITRANAALSIGPENQLRRARQFPDADFREVVRPNVDTLYTSAFIDMTRGPWVFEMAANGERYAVMSFMDAWSNVFAAPGTRTTGAGGGKFLLADAAWQGPTPPGLTLLRAPTRIVWLVGRTQTMGVADYALVHRLQDGVTLRTLADWRSGTPESAAPWQPATEKPLPPVLQMRALDSGVFFSRLSQLMVHNRPAAADAAMMARLRTIGIVPGQPPQWNLFQRWGVDLGRKLAERKIAMALAEPRELVRGWSTPPVILGRYGIAYDVRAIVAMVGLGANLAADATYPNARVDAGGQALNGQYRYRLHFKAHQLPPVNAFWSVTAYGADDYFIANALRRYALGGRDALAFNADGSLDLLVQAEPPNGGQNNWLPVKAGQPFLLNARLYWPRPAALDGSWGMPALERIE